MAKMKVHEYAKQIGIDITLFTDRTFGEVVYPYNKIDYIF